MKGIHDRMPWPGRQRILALVVGLILFLLRRGMHHQIASALFFGGIVYFAHRSMGHLAETVMVDDDFNGHVIGYLAYGAIAAPEAVRLTLNVLAAGILFWIYRRNRDQLHLNTRMVFGGIILCWLISVFVNLQMFAHL